MTAAVSGTLVLALSINGAAASPSGDLTKDSQADPGRRTAQSGEKAQLPQTRSQESESYGIVLKIDCDGKTTSWGVTGGTVSDVLEMAGVSLGAQDAVNMPLGKEVSNGDVIEVDRAFSVKINCDGESVTAMVAGDTVREALNSAGITLSEMDEVSPEPDSAIKANDVVTVVRKELVTWEDATEIPFETKQSYSPEVSPGQEKVQVEGEAGMLVNIYTQLHIDGVPQDEPELVRTERRKEPVDRQVLTGYKTPPVSNLDFGWTFDENGEPVGYTRVLRGQKAAGYSAPPGSGTASGLPAVVGHVAVNPNVIPYGSKLFIRSADGSFVYGYAIAADTGGSLRRGIIGVDLYYDTMEKAAGNGMKTVDIFVLE